jgi:hypothetical protein
MKYDDASWHVGNAESDEHAAAHIGLYFRWCAMAGLLSEDHTEDPELGRGLDGLKNGSTTGTDYIWEVGSGKLSDVDLTDEGNAFTAWFYSKRYLPELRSVTGKRDYSFTERDVEFEPLRQRLDAALQGWRHAPPKKSWWRFW